MVDLIGVKITGTTINSIIQSFMSQGVAKSFIENALGTAEIKLDEFYPADKFHEMLGQIEKDMHSAVVRRVGMNIIETAKWPPGIENAEAALASIDVAYKMNHEPNDPKKIGTYTFKKIDYKNFEIHCDNAYPCSLDDGVIYAAAKKFHDNTVAVKHVKGSCRSNGDQKCVYTVKLY